MSARSCGGVWGTTPCWRRAPGPECDPSLTVDDTVTIAVQVKGKLRGTIDQPAGADRVAVETAALALPAVSRQIEGRDIRKIIVVPDRIVNIVV